MGKAFYKSGNGANRALANVTATYTNQRIGQENPISLCQLPDGERIQIVLPPAIENGTVSMTILFLTSQTDHFRNIKIKAFLTTSDMGNLKEFEQFKPVLRTEDIKLVQFLENKDLEGFFKFCCSM